MNEHLSTIGKRLNYARKQRGLTYTELASYVDGATGAGLNTAFLRNTVKDSYVNKIIKILKINENWARLGEGEVFTEGEFTKNNIKNEIKQVPFEDFMEVNYIPVTAQAGYLSSLEGINSMDFKTMLVPKEFEKGNYTVVEISGPSMDDGSTRSICDGDKLLVKEWEGEIKSIPYRQYLFVIVSREGFVCKQILNHDLNDNTITCSSFNPTYPDYKINTDDIFRLFIVKKIVERRIKI